MPESTYSITASEAVRWDANAVLLRGMDKKTQINSFASLPQPLRPFLVTRRQLYWLFGSARLVQRMLRQGWIDVVIQGKAGRESLYDYMSAARAFDRLKLGERPALLPCECKGEREV